VKGVFLGVAWEESDKSPGVRPRALLLDIDGVLYIEDEPVHGAGAAVQRLRAAGTTLRFVTNTTSRSRASTLEKLRRLGFEVADHELITPAALAVRVCRERGHRRVALYVADGVEADFAGLDRVDGAGADAVIVGDLGEAWDYAALNAAFRLIMDGAELIALQKNRFWQHADGLALDVGPFVAALEYATRRTATVVGKPAAAFFEQALADAGAEAADAAIPTSAARSARGSPGSWCAPASTARSSSGRAGSSRPRRSTRSPTCPRW
jgi:HAD superfamily hydrolase (TIGR01458 family)